MGTELVHEVAKAACAHCALPVPRGLLDPEQEHQFCCQGCRLVYDLIHAEGLGDYYQLRDHEALARAADVSQRYEDLDDEVFQTRHCRQQNDGSLTTELYLEGVHCSACLWLIEKSIGRIAGVQEARLNFSRRQLSLRWSQNVTPLSEIALHLARLGYEPHPKKKALDQGVRDEERRLLIRLGVAGAVAGNVMLMAFALYGGWLDGMSHEFRQFFRWASLLVSLPSVTYAAWPFYRGAINGLRQGVLHMDLPITVGLGAGILGGVFNTIRGAGEIYFESVAALIFLLLVGRLLQLRQQRSAAAASELLYALTPSSARRLDAAGGAHRVPLEALQKDDVIEVRPGETIPSDGYVERGSSAVDLSLLSGESMPVDVARGSAVFGGTKNLQDVLRIRLSGSIETSRVARIAQQVAQAASDRAPIVQLADALAARFVAVVLVAASVCFVMWLNIDPSVALDHAVALLIVSCPCALGLATPLAITAASGKAARRGILPKSGIALEALGRMKNGVIFFDKTGTITEGRLKVVSRFGPNWVLSLAAAAETQSPHPIARTFVSAFGGQEHKVEDKRAIAGAGIEARVDGRRVVVGAPDFVKQHGLCSDSFLEAVSAWPARGMSPIWVSVDGRIMAAAALQDELRSDAMPSFSALRARGFELHLLSGDAQGVVDAAGEALDVPPEHRHARQSPEDKLQVVQTMAQTRPVVMVGDGANDAAALAAATVGIAVHGGAETSLAAADVFIQKPGVSHVVELVDGARATTRVIMRNIAFSLVYNLFGISLAMAGLLHPLVAALLMPVSSLVVVTNSFRFRFSKEVSP